tara:strand:- start:477 stop:1559 length:1083 start_codon:yes stop_codon:yes gene_type:complete
MKKLSYYLLTIFILIFFVLLLDFTLSNTILNYKNCYKYEKFYYELKKNCVSKYRFKKSFPIVKIVTDEMGLRVGEKSFLKNENKKNIFIFGDSFTYGVGLEFEKTYAGLIEKKFSNYNVYNFGVSSYSPSVYLYKLKKTLNEKIIPEKILLFLDLTDLKDEAIRWEYIDSTDTVKLINDQVFQNSKKKERFTKRNFKLMNNIASYINYHSRNLRELTNIRFNEKRKIKTSVQGSFTYIKQDLLDKRFWKNNTFLKGKTNLRKRLLQIADISKKNNIEFYLIIYPWAETLEFGQKNFSWSEFASEICSNKNCHLIDAIPYFQNYKNKNINWSTELYFLNDEHFNEKGANLLFNVIATRIKE